MNLCQLLYTALHQVALTLASSVILPGALGSVIIAAAIIALAPPLAVFPPLAILPPRSVSVLSLQVQQTFSMHSSRSGSSAPCCKPPSPALQRAFCATVCRCYLLRLSSNPCKLVTDVTDVTDLVMAAVNAVLLTALTLAVALALAVLALALAVPLPVAVPVPVALLLRPANAWAGILSFSRACWFQRFKQPQPFTRVLLALSLSAPLAGPSVRPGLNF